MGLSACTLQLIKQYERDDNMELALRTTKMLAQKARELEQLQHGSENASQGSDGVPVPEVQNPGETMAITALLTSPKVNKGT